MMSDNVWLKDGKVRKRKFHIYQGGTIFDEDENGDPYVHCGFCRDQINTERRRCPCTMYVFCNSKCLEDSYAKRGERHTRSRCLEESLPLLVDKKQELHALTLLQKNPDLILGTSSGCNLGVMDAVMNAKDMTLVKEICRHFTAGAHGATAMLWTACSSPRHLECIPRLLELKADVTLLDRFTNQNALQMILQGAAQGYGSSGEYDYLTNNRKCEYTQKEVGEKERLPYAQMLAESELGMRLELSFFITDFVHEPCVCAIIVSYALQSTDEYTAPIRAMLLDIDSRKRRRILEKPPNPVPGMSMRLLS